MDSHEAAKIVRDRISMVEPESVTTKIMAYLERLDLRHVEMIRLALGADNFIHSVIQKAKNELAPVISPSISPTIIPSPLSDSPMYNPFSTVSPRQIPSPFRNAPSYWDSPLDTQPIHNVDFSLPEEYSLHNQFVNLEKEFKPVKHGNDDYYCSEAVFNHLGIRGSRNAPNLIDYPIKTCHYFKQGFCKHGNNCRYFHGESFPESYPPLFSSNSSDSADEDQVLEKLELEITELMKSRKGYPVSIAALPLMYHEKYGKQLRADGYLTESQRHGRPGYSLTKLFAKLKSIRLIERPHGQHAVILAEDAPKYLDIRSERNDPGPIVSGSRQIYLTFPADSTFSEHDVSNYFSTFGPVEAVRIPCQQKRMFGFVTFLSSDTVKAVLSKGNPHYVCGARVLVKPYREKSKLVERKYHENFDFQYNSRHEDDCSPPEFQSNHSRWLQNQIFEAHEREWILRSQFQLAQKSFARQPSLNYAMDRLRVSQDSTAFTSAEDLNYLFGMIGSNNNNCNGHESIHGINLPDSPFTSVEANSISAVI